LEPFSDLLSEPALHELKGKKNLLAFSAGVDSSALFFLLLQANIPFDMVIVDYGLRAQSKEEVAYAKELAAYHDKILYHDSVTLLESNFEHQARRHRYNFFEKIIHENSFNNLITAHQLNDRLEWFLMQLSKGAGLVEMLGFDEVVQRNGYRLIRPLIHTDKEALLFFLDYHDKRYFIDESNSDEKYKRNHIRANFSETFLKEYKQGVSKSFHYLQKDKEALFSFELLYHDKELRVLKRGNSDIRSIDKVLKEMGYLLSAAQKEEILRQRESVICDKIVVALVDGLIFIAPFVRETMDKKFKEKCRTLGIPAKIRPYLKVAEIDPTFLPRIEPTS